MREGGNDRRGKKEHAMREVKLSRVELKGEEGKNWK